MREYTDVYGLPFVALAARELGSDIEVDGEGKMIKRKRALEKDTTAWERTVYAKGFGEGSTEHNSQEQIEEWFKQFGQIAAVRTRREDDDKGRKNRGNFKGSVFTEFKTLSDAKKFVAAGSGESSTLTFNGTPVVAMTKEEYVQMKVKELGLDASNIVRDPKKDEGGKSAGGGRPNPAGKFNAFNEMAKIKASGGRLPVYLQKAGVDTVPEALKGDLKNKRKRDDDDERDEKKAKVEQGPLTITYNGSEIQVDRTTGEPLDKAALTFPSEAVLKFTNCGPDSDWKQLKQDIIDTGIENGFLNFPKGQTWGYFALPSTIDETTMQKLKDAKLTSGGQEIAWERVTGDEERNFYAMRAGYQGKAALKKLAEAEEAKMAESRKKWSSGDSERRGGGRGGRGGRGGNRGGNRGGRGGNRGGGRGGNRDRGDRSERRDRDGGAKTESGGPRMDTDVSNTMSKSGAPPTIG